MKKEKCKNCVYETIQDTEYKVINCDKCILLSKKDAPAEAKPVRIDVLSINTDLFGKNLEYKKGDIVVWKGYDPAILRIGYDFKADFRAHVLECAKSTDEKYNSLHYSNLRLATDEEIKYLGDLEFFVL